MESLAETIMNTGGMCDHVQKIDVDGVLLMASAIVGVDIRTPNRTRLASIARAVASYRLRLYGLTYQQIATIVGKTHATIIYYVRIMEDALEMPAAFRDIVCYWKQMLEIYPL